MFVRGSENHLKNFHKKISSLGAIFGRLLPVGLIALLMACGGGSGLVGGVPGGPPNNLSVGVPVGGENNATGNSSNPGGQPTQDGVIREGPGAMQVGAGFDPREQVAVDQDNVVASADLQGETPPENPTNPNPKFPGGIVVGNLDQVLDAQTEPPPIQVMIQHLTTNGYYSYYDYKLSYREIGEHHGAVIPVYHTPGSKSADCNENFKIWACTIVDGKYYESSAEIRLCPYGTWERPYGILPTQAKTNLVLHQQTNAKACPNPTPTNENPFLPNIFPDGANASKD